MSLKKGINKRGSVCELFQSLYRDRDHSLADLLTAFESFHFQTLFDLLSSIKEVKTSRINEVLRSLERFEDIDKISLILKTFPDILDGLSPSLKPLSDSLLTLLNRPVYAISGIV